MGGRAPEGPFVTNVVLSSNEVAAGALFACTKGATADGHDFAPEAVDRGAVALLCERRLDLPVPQVLVPSSRAALGPLAAAFWRFPSERLVVVGVTGTNGKTTTCALIASIFEAHGWRTGVIGTLSGQRTTPEAPSLQKEFSEILRRGHHAVTMEVSSHSLVQHRVDGTKFACSVFTNMSQDHLDYHGTMDEYFEAKALLFTRCSPGVAVVNTAGPWGKKLAARLNAADLPTSPRRVVTFAADDAEEIQLFPDRSCFVWQGHLLELNMGGRFNIANAVAAVVVAAELGVAWEAIAEGLRSAKTVKGRFELVDEGQQFAVLVDFAHTPAALAEVLRAARELVGPGSRAACTGRQAASEGTVREKRRGRVIVVFGAGGERDKSKRPLMGQTAAREADVVIVTSDNPRSEQPSEIIAEIVSGMGGSGHVIEPDRAAAIQAALSLATEGDVVLIAGKGHETGQDFGTHVVPFDDVAVARAALRAVS